MLYKFIALISIFVRQFLLPNPFKALDDLPIITIGNTRFILKPDVLNYLAGIILLPITYAMVGLFYERGSAPAWGSFLFFMFYCIHTALLYLMCIAGFASWAVVLIIVGYTALLIVGIKLYNYLTCKY